MEYNKERLQTLQRNYRERCRLRLLVSPDLNLDDDTGNRMDLIRLELLINLYPEEAAEFLGNLLETE